MNDKTISVLLIEDNPGDARLIEVMLGGADEASFELHVADRLEAGLKQLKDNSVDVILLDLSLPDSTGLDTFTRTHETAPGVPIVMLTGLSDQTLAIKAMKQGAQDYLVKGQVDEKVLARALRYAIERKQAEEEVRKLNQELEQRVIDRTRDLDASNRELEAFVYSVSHDLRAPLRRVEGFSAAMMEDCDNLLDGKGREYLERISEGTAGMGRLIDALLELSRVAKADMEREEVDLGSMARSVIGELQETQPRRGVECIVREGLKAKGDERLLRLVLRNLLGNAWKFTQKRGSAKIEFGAREDNGRRVFFVRDNGAGFDMGYAGKLFTPFARLHSDDEFSGTGIGLATVRRIVSRHGGKVWAEGEVGKGATLYFTLQKGGGTE
ncbi:MAG: ATP-binding protein [Pseudomonadota bacterium]